MPGICFAEVRARIALADVLALIGFVPCVDLRGSGGRGPCPVHHSATPSSRSFSANLRLHIYRCFKCGSTGNQLDLYASVTGLSVFEAAITLCEELHCEIPWVINEHTDPAPSCPASPTVATEERDSGRRAGPTPTSGLRQPPLHVRSVQVARIWPRKWLSFDRDRQRRSPPFSAPRCGTCTGSLAGNVYASFRCPAPHQSIQPHLHLE